MYDLVNRYLRRLDQETQKFKLELEADDSGITEILEKSMYIPCNSQISTKTVNQLV